MKLSTTKISPNLKGDLTKGEGLENVEFGTPINKLQLINKCYQT